MVVRRDFGSHRRADANGDSRAARVQYRLGRAAAVLARTVQYECHQRARVSFGRHVGGELIDARAYSADRSGSVGTGEVNALELVQAYLGFDLGDVLGKGSETALEMGRFTMDLGSRRLVSRNNFRNTTNAFAGARVRWQGAGKGSVTAFYTLPLIREPADKDSILANAVKWDRESFDLVFWGGFASQPVGGGATLEAYVYALDEDDSPKLQTRNRHLYTPGLRLFTAPSAGRWDYELEAAYQFGHLRENATAQARKLAVSAYTIHGEVGYRFAAPWSPRLALEYDRASGDRRGGRYGRFDNLYGSRRSDFGPTSTFGALGRSNISSLGLRLDVAPDERWDGFLHYSANWLDSASDSFATTGGRDPDGGSGDAPSLEYFPGGCAHPPCVRQTRPGRVRPLPHPECQKPA